MRRERSFQVPPSRTNPSRSERLPDQTIAAGALLAGAMTMCGCSGTQGNLLVSLPDAAVSDDAATPRPRPPQMSTWQIQLSGTLDTSVDVQVYTADVETPPSVIQALHAAGRIVICYFSAGSMEPFRADAAQFPASALGGPVQGYPSETWIDIRNETVRSIMQARLAHAADVGCDGLHPSGLAAFQTTTGFDFTRADQLAYDRWLASISHGLGLSMGLVDGDRSLSQDLVADFDWTVVWSCLTTSCDPASPFLESGKAAFLVEFGDASRVGEVCPAAKTLGLSAIIKRNTDLDAFRVGCP